jgi:hypothetical protein
MLTEERISIAARTNYFFPATSLRLRTARTVVLIGARRMYFNSRTHEPFFPSDALLAANSENKQLSSFDDQALNSHGTAFRISIVFAAARAMLYR